MPLARIGWWIDWDDSGFASGFDELTERRITASLSLGGRVGANSFAVSPASGQLTIHNRDATYDPDLPGGLSETQIRSRHDARCTVDGVAVWEGKAQFHSKNETSRVRTLTFGLAGRDTTVAAEGTVELSASGGTLNGLIAAAAEQSGLSIAGGTSQPVGLVNWRGSPLYALEAMQRFGGGFMVETARGQWLFVRWTDTPQMPVEATFGTDDYHLMDGYRLSERAGWVRNYVEAEGSEEVPTTTAEALTGHRLMGPQQQAVILLASPSSSAPAEASAYTVSPETASIVNVQFRVLGGRRVGYVRVQTTASHPAGAAVTVTAPAEDATAVRAAEPKRLDVTIYDTQKVFGQRALKQPPWYNATYDGLTTWTKPYLRNLSQPALIYTATYLLASTPEQNAALGLGASPGNRCVFEQATTSFDGLVLSAALNDTLGQVPSWTVDAIAAIDRPAPPLGVTLTPSDTQVVAVVSAEKPNSQNVYGRYRTS